MAHPRMLRLALALSLAALSCAAPLRRQVGALVYDGLPALPDDARARQYLEARFATFLDWDPDGRGVFVSTRFAEAAQLHHVAAPLGMRRQLTFAREPVSGGAAWAGKTRGVVYRTDLGGSEAWQYVFLNLDTGASRVVTDGRSRNDGWLAWRGQEGGAPRAKALFTSTRRNGRDADLYLVEGDEPGEPRLVSEVQGRVYPMDWSADGKLALVLRFVSITETHLYVLDVERKTLTPLEANAPAGRIARGAPRFSRTDPGVVFFTSDEGGEFHGLYRLERATGKKELLTPSLRWDVEGVALSPDGRTLAYRVNEGGQSALYLGPVSAPGEAKRVDLPMGLVTNMRFDPAGARLGFAMTGPTAPFDVHALDVTTGALTRWTQSETGGLDPARFVAPTLVSYKTFDGRRIPAWYYRAERPAAPGARSPVTVFIHGGPESQATVYFSPYTQFLVRELGVSVLVPNVRGSAGYGKRYVALDDGEKREDSVKDIGALLDWIAAQPELDASRVAVFGGSYGGYMVLASMTHFAERLRCGIDVVGISNFVTFLENTKSYRRDLRRVEYGDERDPKMRAFLERISPTNNVHKLTKPLFVIQGANDPRVPESEAEQIVRAVRQKGRDVWYLLARDEGHGFRKKSNIAAMLQAMAAFLRRHLLGETPATGAAR